jgi:hypothetical protein
MNVFQRSTNGAQQTIMSPMYVCMTRGGHGLPKVSLWPHARPFYALWVAIPVIAIQPFHEWLPVGQGACGQLLPPRYHADSHPAPTLTEGNWSLIRSNGTEGIWQGVAMDSLKSPFLLRPPAISYPSTHFRGRWSATLFYLSGYPMPYVFYYTVFTVFRVSGLNNF